jgi:hypothetical protein
MTFNYPESKLTSRDHYYLMIAYFFATYVDNPDSDYMMRGHLKRVVHKMRKQMFGGTA